MMIWMNEVMKKNIDMMNDVLHNMLAFSSRIFILQI